MIGLAIACVPQTDDGDCIPEAWDTPALEMLGVRGPLVGGIDTVIGHPGILGIEVC